MKAVIMAGGEGTRLRPLTCSIPKPMVPVGNIPVMEHTINHLKKYNIREVAITMAYCPTVITDYFGDGQDWGIKTNYFTEHIPLGTGGSVLNTQEFLDGTFIIISGDALTDIDIEKAVSFHKERQSKATLVLKKASIPLEYGVVITDNNGRIIRFLEKPSWGEVFSDTINTGIYILEPEVLEYYKKGDNFDFSKDLFPKLLRDNVPMYGYISDEYWNDIGDLRVYNEVNFDVLQGRVKLNNNYKEVSKGVWIGENTIIEDGCNMIPPIYIGDNCIVKKGSMISESIISNNCEIGNNCSIKRSIIWKNCDLSPNVHCRGSVICNNVNIKNSVQVFENTVIGNETNILSGAVIKPDIKIWPGKTIEEDAIVSQNLVWGAKVAKALFGFRDISGDINTELTPEFCSKLGSAFGSMFKEDSKIVVSTDESNASSVVKESIISGILSTGIKLIDINNVAMPINRYGVKFYNADGGVHIRRDFSPEYTNKVHIEIINNKGINIDRNTERKIENIFARGDFKRCNADSIKDIQRIVNFAEFYIQNAVNSMKNVTKISTGKFKLVIGSRSELALFLSSAFFESIGCTIEADFNNTKAISLKDFISRTAEQVVRKGANMGIALSEDCESVVIIDHQGKIIDNNKYTTLASLLALKTGAVSKLVVPYTATRKIEKMAAKYQASVIRTKSVPSEIMKGMVNSSEADEKENLQYLLHYDAIRGVGHLIDYLVGEEITLSDILSELPELFMEKNEIKCDWKHKGRVIREIIENNKEKNLELFEGVMIDDEKGWVLVLPDSEKPVCNVYTEGNTEEYAKELATIYSEKISGIVSAHLD